MDYDLVVIGGGLAGLTAANRAAELGLHPVVLERGGDELYPCNSRWAGGLVHLAFKDMTAGADEIHAAIERVFHHGAEGVVEFGVGRFDIHLFRLVLDRFDERLAHIIVLDLWLPVHAVHAPVAGAMEQHALDGQLIFP